MFISKKQKKVIKERRRKKKLAAPDNSETVNTKDVGAAPKNGTSTAVAENASTDGVIDKTGPLAEAKVMVDGRRIVTVPTGLDQKETKKFRKDVRRQARKQGVNEDKIVFVNEGEDVPTINQKNSNGQTTNSNKKRKREFPNINELMKEDQQANEKRAKKEALQQAESELSYIVKDRYRAVDCEMVGIGKEGKISALARVSVTNWNGLVLLDTFVKVPTKVTDYRTKYSGVAARDLKSDTAMEVEECRAKVAELLKDKILVGHALKNDLDALMLTHPKEQIRDTARYRPYQRLVGQKWRPRKLRDLVKQHCDMEIQKEGESHDSIDDARASMELFKVSREAWEAELEKKGRKWASY
mmetsp:Transcript_24116/g.50137  ORF Transcript_24116/g.50137 Transcript_24116/m.50137 type:complete len:356 (-) Transcript_24116:3845-4912(-)